MTANYWQRSLRRRIGRRRALAGAGSAAAAALFLAACGGDEDSETGGPATGATGGGVTGGTSTSSGATGAGPSGGGATGGGPTGGGTGASGLLTKPVDTTDQATRGGTLKDSRDSDSPSLDVHQNYRALVPLYETVMGRLVGFKPGHLEPSQNEPTGDLAESWEISGDKLTVTFKMRPGVTWHPIAPVDGRALDIEDVMFSWSRFTGVGNQRTAYANNLNPDAPILSVDAPDAETIVVKLKEPNFAILAMLGARENVNIVPKEGADQNVLDLRRTMVGTGPFYLSEYKTSLGWTLKAFENFWDQDLPLLGQVDYPIITEYAAVMSQLQAGNLHVFTLNQLSQTDVLPLKEAVPDLDIYLGNLAPSGYRRIFGWQTPEVRDERVRQAFSMCYDRDLWINAVFDTADLEATGLPVETRWNTSLEATDADAAGGWWLDPQGSEFGENARYYAYNVEEAKKLMSAAGFADGLDLVDSYVEGPQYGAKFHEWLQITQGMEKAIGIRHSNNPQDYSSEFGPNYRDSRGKFEGISTKLGPPSPSEDPVGRLSFDYYSKGGAGFYGFDADGQGEGDGDPHVDEEIAKAFAEFDEDGRREIVLGLQRYLAKTSYAVRWPGGKTQFELAWPSLGNYRVWLGGGADTYRTNNSYWWVDATKPGP